MQSRGAFSIRVLTWALPVPLLRHDSQGAPHFFSAKAFARGRAACPEVTASQGYAALLSRAEPGGE